MGIEPFFGVDLAWRTATAALPTKSGLVCLNLFVRVLQHRLALVSVDVPC